MPQETRDLIFVSYSHRDKAWLEKLLIFLKPYQRKGQLTVWADPYIEVGDVWKREIDHALPRAKVGLLLVSPHFLDSDFIMNHEVPPLEEAAEKGYMHMFCVPVSSSSVEPTGLDKYQWARPPKEPLDLLPEPEQHAALVMLSKTLVEIFQKKANVSRFIPGQIDVISPSPIEIQSISVTPSPVPLRMFPRPVNLNQEETAPLGMLYGVPSQRPHFQERPKELDRLKTSLLEELHAAVGLTGKTTKFGVHGQGGIGKTVLAIALANDKDVRRTFPDGIFWFTLGQTPDLIAIQFEWLKTLGEKSPVISTINDGKQQLQSHLAGKTCLLIVDDIWQADHAAVLDVLGPASPVLLTTRDATILTAIGAKEELLGVLGQEAALRLLAEWSGKALQTLPLLAARVAESCGGIPLALALAGAQLHEGMECERLLNALEAGDLEFLDHPYGSIFKTMKLSVQALPEFERARYLELVVFPEDAHVPERVIEHLWSQTAGLTPNQTHKLLAGFSRKSLLLRKEERQLPGISFHDLQHDFLRLMVPDAAPVHRQLLEGYRQTLQQPTQDFSWSALPDDETYLWTYMPYHLMQGGQREELTATVKDLRFLGKKIWLFGASAVEGDIQRAIPGSEQDKGLRRLQRLIPQSAHLLDGQSFLGGLLTTLFSRVQGETSLEVEVKRLEQSFDFPYLKPLWPMPDLPDPGLVRTLEGHTTGGCSCAIHPTGQWIVSVASDGKIKVWDLPTGNLLRTFEGHTKRISSCVIHPTGWCAVSGSDDRTLKVWDFSTGELVRTLEGHTGGVTCCVIDPRGRWMVSGSFDRTLKLWDLTTGDLMHTFEGHKRTVTSCVIDPTRRWMVSGSDDQTLKVWDMITGNQIHTLLGHIGAVKCCAIDPTYRLVVSGGEDQTLKVWKFSSGELLHTLQGHTGMINCCVIDPTGKWIVSGARDGTLRIWELETRKFRRSLEGHHPGFMIHSCAIDPTGRWMVTGGWDPQIKIWDIFSEDYQPSPKRQPKWVLKKMDFSPSTGLWTAKLVHNPKGSHTGWVLSCATDTAGQRMVTGGLDHMLKILDLTTGRVERTLEGHEGVVKCCAIDSMRQRVISGASDRTLKLWNLITGNLEHTFEGHTGTIKCCAVDPTGQWMVSGASDRTLRIWNLTTGNLEHTLEGHTGMVNCCAIDPTGQWIISGAEDQVLKVWNLATSNLEHTLEGFMGMVNACAIDPTGHWVLSVAAETLNVWNLTSGELVQTLEGHTGVCAIDSTGQWVSSLSRNGEIQISEYSSGKVITLIRVDGLVSGIAWIPHVLRFAAVGTHGVYVFELIPPQRLHNSPNMNARKSPLTHS